MKCSYILLILVIIEKVYSNVLENNACRDKRQDIMLMLDASEDVSQEDFLKQLRLVSDMVNSFDTGSDKTRIKTLVVGDKVTPAINVGDMQTEDIETDMTVGKDGKTSSGEALFHLRTRAFHAHKQRHGVPCTGILLLFGAPRDRERTRMEAKMAHEQGIILIVLGVGNKIDKTEIDEIASSPEHIVMAENLNTLDETEAKLMNLTCAVRETKLANGNLKANREGILRRGEKCSPKGALDIAIAFNAAGLGIFNSELVLRFLAGVTDRLQTNWNESSVLTITNQCNSVNLQDVMLGTGNDARSVSQFFEKIKKPSIIPLLKELDEKVTNKNGKSFLILIVTNRLSKSEYTRAKKQLKEYQRNGAKILVIGVGDNVSDRQGRAIASLPEDYFFAPTFESLLDLEGPLLLAVCEVPSE